MFYHAHFVFLTRLDAAHFEEISCYVNNKELIKLILYHAILLIAFENYITINFFFFIAEGSKAHKI